jgi:hypothetical protein
MSSEPFVEASGEAPHVRGVLHRPATARGGEGLVLTHGAGSSVDSPLLVALATALAARGLTVLRCDLPFRQARRTGPPRAGESELDREGLRRAVEALRALLDGPGADRAARIYLGGHSYGGRQASMLVAESPEIADALLLLSYPLHPPQKPAQLRVRHFPSLRTPAMFVHGSTDPFGTVAELREALGTIPARTSLVVVDGAGHDLRPRGARRGSPQLSDTVVDEVVGWLAICAA